MRRKIVAACAAIILLAGIGGVGFYFGQAAPQGHKENRAVQQEKVVSQTIAVVNLDEGTTAPGRDKVYYGEKVIQFPSSSFVYTALEDARQGIEDGTYGAYILVPATFSDSVDSLNGTPRQADFQYEISEGLTGDTKAKVLGQVLKLGETLNTDLSYMYLANILTNFHKAQDDASMVMANDFKDKGAIDSIQAMDLVEMVSMPSLKRDENTTAAFHIAPFAELNRRLVKNMDDLYETSIGDTKTELAAIKGSGKSLAEELEVLSKNVGQIDLTIADNPDKPYEGGLKKLYTTLEDYNGELSDGKTTTSQEVDSLEAERVKIVSGLNHSIETYNNQLETQTQTNLSSYKDALRDKIPKMTLSSVPTHDRKERYILTCDPMKGKGRPPVVAFEVVPDKVLNTQIQDCLNGILKEAISTGLDVNTANKEVNVDYTYSMPEIIDNGDGTYTIPGLVDNGDGTYMLGPKQQVTGSVLHKESKSLDEILDQCNADPDLAASMQACGYTKAQDMIADYVDGTISTMTYQTYKLVSKGSIDDLTAYLGSGLDEVSTSGYNPDGFRGDLADQAGNSTTVEALLEQLTGQITTVKEQVSDFNFIDSKGTTDSVKEGCVVPMLHREDSTKAELVKKGERAKKTIQERYKEETTQISQYQNVLGRYNPILNTSDISKNLSQISANHEEMEKGVRENNQAYMEYASKTFTTTQENVTSLQTHIQESQSASQNAVEKGLAYTKSLMSGTSAANQQAMGEFVQLLPFTRLGTMEYTQAYQFIANPLSMTSVSNNQRGKAVSTQVSTNTADTGMNITRWKNGYTKRMVYSALILCVLSAVIWYFMQRRREERMLQ